ncbi:MAG: ribbon-helix-helix domain-containing protein [Terriglobales bacterium]
MATDRITIRLSRKLMRQVEEKAAAGKKKVSSVVREALAEHCASPEEGPTAHDLAKKLGLLGAAKGLPSDLSTNKKYFRGFGKH